MKKENLFWATSQVNKKILSCLNRLYQSIPWFGDRIFFYRMLTSWEIYEGFANVHQPICGFNASWNNADLSVSQVFAFKDRSLYREWQKLARKMALKSSSAKSEARTWCDNDFVDCQPVCKGHWLLPRTPFVGVKEAAQAQEGWGPARVCMVWRGDCTRNHTCWFDGRCNNEDDDAAKVNVKDSFSVLTWSYKFFRFGFNKVVHPYQKLVGLPLGC